MKGLIIRDPWITKILNGEKVWEIRGSITKIRGTIALIKSGSGLIYGTVELTDCIPCPPLRFKEHADKHRIEDESKAFRYKSTWAWKVKNPIRYPEPIPYKHPQGAVIWVNLDLCGTCFKYPAHADDDYCLNRLTSDDKLPF